MALESPAYVISADSHSAALFRQAIGSLISGTGVIGSGDLQVTANGTPNMSVNVAVGQVWMPGTLGATTGFPSNLNAQTAYGLPAGFTSQGPYMGYQDGTVNLTIAAADPTNPRKDIVYAAIQDAQYSGSNNQPVLLVATGTAAPSPSAPTAPASAVVLAEILVPAGATSITSGDITDKRSFFMPGPLSSSPYRATVYRNGAWTTVTGPAYPQFDTNTYNPAGYFTANLFTCPAAGDYSVKASLGVTATAVNQYFYLQIVHNATVVAGGAQYHSVGTNDFMTATVNYEQFQCAAGDTLAIQYGCSTAGLTGSTGPVNNWAIFRYLGR